MTALSGDFHRAGGMLRASVLPAKRRIWYKARQMDLYLEIGMGIQNVFGNGHAPSLAEVLAQRPVIGNAPALSLGEVLASIGNGRATALPEAMTPRPVIGNAPALSLGEVSAQRPGIGNCIGLGSDLLGGHEELRKRTVWNKGKAIPGTDRNEWRLDDYGNRMRFSAYGDTRSPDGWQIDHIVPVAGGGTDDIGNLRPLHWRKNASLGGHLSRALSAGPNT